MQLLIEAGNTYVKVAQLFQTGDLELLGRYPSKKLEMVLEPLLEKGINRIVFASVGPVEVDNSIQRIAQLANIPVLQVKTLRKDFGVKNAYAEYQYLGVDRWLTLASIFIVNIGRQHRKTCPLLLLEKHIQWIIKLMIT